MASLKAMAREAKKVKKPSELKKAPKQTAPKQQFKSTEFIQESDEEDEDNSDEESHGDDKPPPKTPLKAVQKTNGKLPPPSGSSSSSESESAEDTESEEEEEEPSASASRASPIPEPVKRLSKESNTKTAFVEERAPYKPPTGFEPSSCDDNVKASKLFRETDLEGKQIWYFTAPTSVPISSIQHMSLQDAKDGKKIFSHSGNDYGFVQDVTGDKTYTKIMVPSSKDGYRAVLKTIDQTLHLQQIVKLPGVHEPESSKFAKATVPAKKPVREQPPGLKMRFQPIGFERSFGSRNLGKIESGSSSAGAASTESGSDAEMTEAPASFRRPASKESEDSNSDESDSSESSESEDFSSSDQEMTGAPRLPAKPVGTPRAEKPSPKHVSNDGSPSSSLKRKHSEGVEKKAKNISSQSTPANDHRQLKRLKTKQTVSQTSSVDIQSASTKAIGATTSMSGSKSSSSLSKPAAILPPSSRIILPASSSPAPRVSHSTTGNKTSKLKPSSEKSTSKNRDRDTPVNSFRDEPSLREISQATDPRLPPEERRAKIKKPKKKRKHEDGGRHSHSSEI